MQKKRTKKETKTKKGNKYTCQECGLVVTIDKPCGCVEECDIICCGQPMKPKKK